MNIRQQTEEFEAQRFCAHATLSSRSQGRLRREREREGDIRTCFQRDRDRIIHCKAFRRLKHKTQVFLAPKGDHYRTRLTHVLEVSQIARTISRALRLNEDLTEAIALGHDLGHTPFGHAGEAVLTEILPEGFRHYEQSLRVVDFLEKRGQGLNLTIEVRDGIVRHSKGKGLIFPRTDKALPMTLEGLIVRVSDIIAYLNHDLDDALRAKVIRKSDLSADVLRTLGDTHANRIDTMVRDFIYTSLQSELETPGMSEPVREAVEELRTFLYKHVYEGDETKREFRKSRKILMDLFEYYMDHPQEVLLDTPPREDETPERRVCDFIAGMTDRFALVKYEEIFLPKQWSVF